MIENENNQWQFLELAEIKIDISRKQRVGLPEAILARGKSLEQLQKIVQYHLDNGKDLLITRCSPEQIEFVSKNYTAVATDTVAECIWKRFSEEKNTTNSIRILTGGSSDLKVALEAEITLKMSGFTNVQLISDIGVANLNRCLTYLEQYQNSDVIIVCAGMEGALPSVIAGLTKSVIIAVPTSGGTGGGLAGIPALLSMLNSCAPGVAVVNIDGGYQAACVAIRVLNLVNRL